jgi:hypothetical protein
MVDLQLGGLGEGLTTLHRKKNQPVTKCHTRLGTGGLL